MFIGATGVPLSLVENIRFQELDPLYHTPQRNKISSERSIKFIPN